MNLLSKLLIDLNHKSDKINQESLDSLVHDYLSCNASDLNNQGPDEQIQFLIEHKVIPKASHGLCEEDVVELDELVDGFYGSLASSINNSGYVEQARYLFNKGITASKIRVSAFSH